MSICGSVAFDFDFDFDFKIFLGYGVKALPNQQTVDYPSFKLVLVGDGGTGNILGYFALLRFLRFRFFEDLCVQLQWMVFSDMLPSLCKCEPEI